MKPSSSTSSILRLHDKSNEKGGPSSPSQMLRRSNSSVTVLHQKQLPSYSAERFYILSELQLNSLPPTFLIENVDDNTTAVTAEMSLENSQETSSQLPLQPYSILYLVWKPDLDETENSVEMATAFCHESISPAVHKIQGITHIRRPSLGQSSSSSSLSQCESDEFDSNQKNDEGISNHPPTFESSLPNIPSTRLYLVVEQVYCNKPEEQQPFEKLRRCATELSRVVSTELRSLVQGISIGVSNNEESAAPGLEACMNAILVGSQDRRRYGTSENDKKSLIGLIAEGYSDLEGPGDTHHDHSHQLPQPVSNQLEQCIVTAEWSAAGDLETFAHRAHAVWRENHQLAPLPSRTMHRKKTVRRVVKTRVVETTSPEQTRADVLYDCLVVSVLVFYFVFHYRQDVADLVAYLSS